MQDIQNAVAEAIKNISALGTIEKLIETQLQKTIGEIVSSELREYSDFGKMIKAKVQQALVIDPDKLTFPVYNDYILEMVKRQVTTYMEGQAQEGINSMLAEMLVAPPKEITFDQLLKEFIEATHDDDYHDGNSGEQFGLKIEDRGDGFTYVYLNKKEQRESYRTHTNDDYQIAIHKGEVFKLTFGGVEIEKKLFAGPFYNFERTLFQLYVAKTQITFPNGTDADSYETYYPERDK